METKTALEWFYFADADLDSALILNDAHHKQADENSSKRQKIFRKICVFERIWA